MSDHKPRYRVTYTYLRPSSAGPFEGRAEVGEKYRRGDEIPAIFGMARVKSCREIKPTGAGPAGGEARQGEAT